MSKNYRFYLNTAIPGNLIDVSQSLIETEQEDLLMQLGKILRIRAGDSSTVISFIDNSGMVYETTLTEFISNSQKKVIRIRFQLNKSYLSTKELKQQITFFIPVIKIERFEIMIQKLSELGVQHLVPVAFEYSQKQNIEKLQNPKQKARLEKIIIEAVEQSEGAQLSELHELIHFDDFIEIVKKQNSALKIFASEELANEKGLEQSSQANLQAQLVNVHEVHLLVGPEGGISTSEVSILKELGFQAHSLGKRLLKAETASIVLFSSLQCFQD